MQYIKKIISLTLVSIILLCLFAYSAMANEDTSLEITSEELETFVDEFMENSMSENNIPGVIVSIIHNDELLVCKGYGYQDVENNILSSGINSMYGIGSVSKLFVYISIMQLYEQGKLDLDTNIHEYLDFQLDLEYDKPITLNNLMTHSAGFEDTVFEMQAVDCESMLSIGEYVKTHQPTQIIPPGELSAYSNYGNTLAAYIVELVSGISYYEYVDQNIFKPLNMDYTVVDSNLYREYSDYISKGYIYKNDSLSKRDEEYYNTAPAGGVKSSARDMSSFMMMLLNCGEYNDVQILKPDTFETMMSTSFTHDVQLCGLAHGFWEGNYKGINYFEHGGDTMNFHTMLTIIDDLDLGIFISCNQSNAFELPSIFYKEILDEFYSENFVINDDKNFTTDLSPYVGTYTSGRNSKTTVYKVVIPFSFLKISDNNDGTLSLMDYTFTPIGDLVFRKEDDGSLVIFTQDENGRIENMYLENYPAIYFYKDKPFENSAMYLGILIFCIVVLLVSIIVWIIYRLKVILKKTKSNHNILGVSAVNSVLALIPVALIASAYINQVSFVTGDILFLKISSILPFLVIAGTIYLLMKLIGTWESTKTITKIYVILLISAYVLYTYWSYTFNLLGWNFI